MNWIIAVAVAAVAFALAAVVFRLPRQNWTVVLTVLVLGLAGYATQASPGMSGAPKDSGAVRDQSGFSLIDARKDVVAESRRSRSEQLLVADALARQGQYANAVAMLNSALRENPRDGESWLALANALVEHADGQLTQPASLAFRRAAQADPRGLGPGYFLGLALMRQGLFGEGRDVWVATLRNAPADAFGRPVMEERLARLDDLLRQAAAQVSAPAPPVQGAGPADGQ